MWSSPQNPRTCLFLQPCRFYFKLTRTMELARQPAEKPLSFEGNPYSQTQQPLPGHKKQSQISNSRQEYDSVFCSGQGEHLHMRFSAASFRASGLRLRGLGQAALRVPRSRFQSSGDFLDSQTQPSSPHPSFVIYGKYGYLLPFHIRLDSILEHMTPRRQLWASIFRAI